MKKIIALVLFAVFALSALAGCVSNGKQNNSNGSGASTAQPAANTADNSDSDESSSLSVSSEKSSEESLVPSESSSELPASQTTPTTQSGVPITTEPFTTPDSETQEKPTTPVDTTTPEAQTTTPVDTTAPVVTTPPEPPTTPPADTTPPEPSTTTPIDTTTPEPPTPGEYTVTEVERPDLTIEPVVREDLTVAPAFVGETLTISEIEPVVFSGKIEYEKQKNNYSFTAPRDGRYRFDIGGIKSGVKYDLILFNNLDEIIKDEYVNLSYTGYYAVLTGGVTYRLQVGYYDSKSIGSYSVTVGIQKPTTDISNSATINDSVTYLNQRNNYVFTAPRNGRYRFDITGIKSGIKFNMTLYDDLDSRIEDEYITLSYSGYSATLTGGKTYYLHIIQDTGLSAYTLKVGFQKPTMDISGYGSAKDSIEFTNQRNVYSFTPEISGRYRFDVTGIKSGIKFDLYLYNDLDEKLEDEYVNLSSSGFYRNLTAGRTYKMIVEQYSGLSEYTLTVGYKKTPVDISGYANVKDSIDYKNQSITYYFTPEIDGRYRFEVNDIKSGIKFDLYLYNELDQKLEDEYVSVGSNGYYRWLSAGKTYTLYLEQYSGFSSFTLSIGYQKETVDITEYDSVKDQLTFKDQINRYEFTADRDGSYRFTATLPSSKQKVEITVYDDLESRIENTTSTSFSLNLKEGKTYTIYIEQYQQFGEYEFKIT